MGKKLVLGKTTSLYRKTTIFFKACSLLLLYIERNSRICELNGDFIKQKTVLWQGNFYLSFVIPSLFNPYKEHDPLS